MKYKILKDFKGSPNGSTVVEYTKGETVELTDSLAAAVVPEGWAKEVNGVTIKIDGPLVDLDNLERELAPVIKKVINNIKPKKTRKPRKKKE